MGSSLAPPRTFAADREQGLATLPAGALRFAAGACELAAGEPADGKIPVKMRARGGQPIHHWYWGNVVHDMAGCKPAGATIPVDYCHDYGEVLGYLDSFSPGNAGLDVAGQLVGFAAGDRVAEVAHKAQAGIPYQASIFFQPESLEEVMPGGETEVNGYKLAGPALVIRKWLLRGVAVCPYGYDPKTQTKLAAGEGEIPITFSVEPVMSVKSENPAETKPASPTELKSDPAPSPASAAADPRAEFAATLKKFTDKFGATHGAAWAAEGLSYEQALEKHAEALAAQLTAAGQELTTAQQKLAAAPRGEKEPVSFADAEKPADGHSGKDPSQLKFRIGENSARVAAGLKFPGTK